MDLAFLFGKQRAFRIIAFVGLCCCASCLWGQKFEEVYQTSHMGSAFSLTAVHDDKEVAWEALRAADSEIARIENLISSWKTSSQTAKINESAGVKPVVVDKELFDLIARSLKISNLTLGAFDPSYASMDRIWKFDGSMKALPDSASVAASVSKIDYKKIVLDQNHLTVYLEEKGMKIGFGAIGKGYAAMRAKDLMQKMGIMSGLVNAGGDLICWGREASGNPWRIALADPDKERNLRAWLELKNQAFVTSGDYERYVEFGGIRYAHIIDPRTGYPVQGLKSVSVLCPNAELADALATAIFVLGKTQGLALVEQLKGIDCLIITNENEIITSKNIQLQYE